MKRSNRLQIIYLILITAITFIPIAVTVVYSFNASKISSIWGGASLKWYRELFRDRDLLRALGNSLILSAAACAISAVIGTLGALGMKKTGYRMNTIISYISNLPIIIPEIILGMVYLAVFSLADLPFGMLTLIIAHCSFCIPYIFMMVEARLEGMDRSVEEAARDLGAGHLKVFFDITLPSIIPALLSGLLLSFAMSFDDVVISIFVTGSRVNTLPIKIYTRVKTGVSPEINALAAILVAISMTMVIAVNLWRNRKLLKKQGGEN